MILSFSKLVILTALLGEIFQCCFCDRNDTLVKEMLLRDISKAWDCNREWPELDIFMPVHLEHDYKRNNEWDNVFLRGFMTFWPAKTSKTTLRIVLDDELRDSSLKKTYIDDVLAERAAVFGEDFPAVNFSYQKPLENVYRTGHDRQQYLMFCADQYTDAEYVAFVDTDTYIHSFVDREDIFHEGKPIVHGKIGYLKNVGRDVIKRTWAANTWMAIGKEEPMICMSYFPIVFKTSHLKDLREHISAHWKRTFDEAFFEFSGAWGQYSQFNIMCAYFFWFKQDEYSWAIHDADPNWNGNNPPPAFAQWADKWVFRPEMLIHRPYVAAHFSGRWCPDYENDVFKRTVQLTSDSLCFSPCPSTGCHIVSAPNASRVANDTLERFNTVDSTQCHKLDTYFTEMHQFEDTNFNLEWITPDKSLILLVHEERRSRLKTCNHTYYFY